MPLKPKPAGLFRDYMNNVIHRDGKNRSDDYLRLCIPQVKFSASSLASVLLDFGLVLTLARLLNSLLLAVVFARCISSTFNYLCNQYFVFTGRKNHRKAAPRYFGLVSVNLALNYLILSTIISTGILCPLPRLPQTRGSQSSVTPYRERLFSRAKGLFSISVNNLNKDLCLYRP